MEKIGEIIRHNQQPSSGTSITPYDSRKHSVPQWALKLQKMSQDMRQDLAPGQLDYWKIELRDYKDDEICAALGLYAGEFFPNVKQIKELIERKRQLATQEYGRKEWDRWKDQHAQGTPATHEELAAMVQECREMWKRLEREGRLVSSGRANAVQDVEANKQSATPANARTPESAASQKVG